MNHKTKQQVLKSRAETVTEPKRRYDAPRTGWKRITIYLEIDTIERLKDAKLDYEVPILEIANRAIKEFLDKHCGD
jgi:hypothetical protein